MVKKPFSVPIGKLKGNAVRCKSGSSSRSSSRSKLQNRLLRKNNRELAYALAEQKERNKIAKDENVRLMTSLHDSHLEVVGWKNKFSKTQKAYSDYHDSVVNHIKDAVRHSVLLTESLKLAMTVPRTSFCGSDRSSQKESESVSSNLVSPMMNRVNPMVSGHTIKYPTVHLKRLDVEVVERITDTNEEEPSEEILEYSPEASVEDSQQHPNVGLSTCIEEDEEESRNRNITRTSITEMHEDSFRRRTVSFRNRTLDKSKQMWQIEVADSSPNKLTDVPETISQLSNKKDFYQRELTGEWECIAAPKGLDRLTPVVALNDISKFLQYSNSVNVLEMAQLGNKILSIARHCSNSPEGEKENLPSNEIVSEPVHLKSNVQQDKASKRYMDEDPLEGTSWMYQDKPKGSNKKTKAVKKSSKRANKEINLNDKKTKARKRGPQSASTLKDVNSNLVDSVTEKDTVKPVMVNDQEQEPSHDLENQKRISAILPDNDICYESLNMVKMKDDIQKNLVVQSTPICSDNRSIPNDIVSSSSISPKLDSDDRSAFVSPESSHFRRKNGHLSEKDLSPAFVDNKLLSSAFVTVRVKRLRDPDDDKQTCESDGFIGFDNENITLEKANAMRKSLSSFSLNLDVSSNENSRTGCESTYSYSKSTDPGYVDSSLDCGSRPKRRAAPTKLKEPSLHVKMRRETMEKKKRSKKRKPDTHKKEDIG